MFVSAACNSLQSCKLTGKVYGTGTVLNRLINQKDLNQKISGDIASAAMKKALAAGTDAACKTPDDVLNESLKDTDNDLHGILKIARYATGNLSDEDRKRCQREIDAYLYDIDENGKKYDEAVKENESKEAADDGGKSINAAVESLEKSRDGNTQNADNTNLILSVESGAEMISKSSTESKTGVKTIASPQITASAEQAKAGSEVDWTAPDGKNWTEKLGVSNLSVATADDAEKAVSAVKSAIKKVEKTIDDIAGKNCFENNDMPNSLSDDFIKTEVTGSTSASEYFNLLKASMLSDSAMTVLSQSSENLPHTAPVLNTVC